MKNQEIIIGIIKESYNSINFINRFKTISSRYDFDLDNIMSRMNKRENLNIMKGLGYKFKITSPGQRYYYEEKINDIKMVLGCHISGGIIISYIYI